MTGILFKPEMIVATVERRKTLTRRAEARLKEINREPDVWYLVASFDNNSLFRFGSDKYDKDILVRPRYQVGETVYIKEAWCESYYGKPICYKLDGGESPGPKGFWRSPLFLKAIHARHFILITDVRPERLQEISDSDAIREGIVVEKGHYIIVYRPSDDGGSYASPRDAFFVLWNSINKAYPWESNPWVFRYEFGYHIKEVT